MEFTDIALAKFLQLAPELSSYILNFSDLTEQLENSNIGLRVGMFVIKIGTNYGFVPVIGKEDTIFPIDSIYIESENLFKPLNSSTINYIINTSSTSLGSVKKIPDNIEKNPSLFNLINPPRTGKFIYASNSRLPEFLAIVPDYIRTALMEKISSEKRIYDTLDKLFGLKAIFSVLGGEKGGNTQKGINSVPTGPTPIIERSQVISVITTPKDIQLLGTEEAAKEFLDHGYFITGKRNVFRSAITYFPYDRLGEYKQVNPLTDGGENYRIVLSDGSTKDAMLPKYHKLNPVDSGVNGSASVFFDGTFARGTMIAVGDPLPKDKILDSLFELSPPKLIRDVNRDELFLMITSEGEALGPFRASSVTRTYTGCEITTYTGNINKIYANNNYTLEVKVIGDTLFVRSNIIVMALGSDITMDLERSPNAAADKRALSATQLLGSEMSLRYDGVEFSADNMPLGKFASAMKYLVEKQEIEPTVAKNFLKQAEEISYLKVFLSKRASDAGSDYRPTEISSYGTVAAPFDKPGLNGTFMSGLSDSTTLGDAQVIESMIISQLLQVPDLFEYIGEYLPDLELTVDKLGRILFVIRLKIDQLSSSIDSDSVFALISQIKGVYRQLGELVLKLKSIQASSTGFNKEDSLGKPDGF